MTKISEYFAELAQENSEYSDAAKEISAVQDFADEVVSRRIALGWTQDKLARAARTTQPVVSRVENGVANPTTRTMDRIRRALQHAEPTRATPATMVLRPSIGWELSFSVPVWSFSCPAVPSSAKLLPEPIACYATESSSIGDRNIEIIELAAA